MSTSNTVLNGTDLVLVIGTTVVAVAKSHTVTIGAKSIDRSSKDSGQWEESVNGRMNFSMKTEGLVAYLGATKLTNYDSLFDLMILKTPVAVISKIAGGTITGTSVYTGTAIIESLDTSSGDDANVTYSVSLKGTGALVKTLAV